MEQGFSADTHDPDAVSETMHAEQSKNMMGQIFLRQC